MNTLLSCIYFWSFLHQIDPAVTKAVISVESNGNPYAVSPDGKDGGLMQIRMKFVPESRIQLLNSCTNVMVGTSLLSIARKKCKHSIDKTWVNCYNLGITGGSRLKYPKKWRYYKKIMARIESRKRLE